MSALSDREIVAAARKIIAEVGVDGLTMRLLSTELGVALGATYHHVPTKHHLLVLVGRDLFHEVSLPSPPVGDWAAQVKALMLRLADVVGRYPGMAGYMLAHVDDTFPAELHQQLVDILAHAGFAESSIAAVLGALRFYVSGMAAGGPSLAAAESFHGVDVRGLFDEGLDLLFAGARLRLDDDLAGRRPPAPA
jgi:AcrR family transcriptional regulator